jgi:hypothetical protein
MTPDPGELLRSARHDVVPTDELCDWAKQAWSELTTLRAGRPTEATCGGEFDFLGCKKPIHWQRYPGGDRVDDSLAIRCPDCGAALCPACARKHFTDEAGKMRVENAELKAEWDGLEQILGEYPGSMTPTVAHALRAERDRLVAAIEDCAVNSNNLDTCGMCGRHFPQCEKEKLWRDDERNAKVFACPGARAREVFYAARKPTP